MSKPEILTTGSKVVYRNRWMTVREDAILRANGSAGIYGVVDKPDFAVIAAVQGQSIYLVEQYQMCIRDSSWSASSARSSGAFPGQHGASAAACRHFGRSGSFSTSQLSRSTSASIRRSPTCLLYTSRCV